jgi:hypothetical protein
MKRERKEGKEEEKKKYGRKRERKEGKEKVRKEKRK